MLYTIESEDLRVQIDSHGGQLWSICSKEDGTQYLWQGDPAFWADRALLLFPICCRLWDNRYTHDGKSYEMDIHGFVWTSELQLVRHEADTLVLKLESTAETLAQYPFHFLFTVTFSVRGGSVHTQLAVENLDEQTLYFALGGHPGFNVPFDGGDFSDYVLEFDRPTPAKALALSADCFLTDSYVMLPLEDGKILPLRHELFDNDALVLKDMAEAVTLRARHGTRKIRVAYAGMPYLGIWHAPKTAAPYVCIEPWTGLPSTAGKVDELSSKQAITALPAHKKHEAGFTITIQ